MDHDVGAEIERFAQPRRCEGRIDDEGQARGVGHLGDAGNVEHFKPRVAENLTEQQLGVVADRRGEGVRGAWINERGLDAETGQRVFEEVVRAAVQRPRSHDVIARARKRRDREVHCGLTAGGGDRADAAFQGTDPFFEDGVGGIGEP